MVCHSKLDKELEITHSLTVIVIHSEGASLKKNFLKQIVKAIHSKMLHPTIDLLLM